MKLKYKTLVPFVIIYFRISLLFLFFYLGSNYLNTFRTKYYHWYFPFEQSIPLYEWAIFPYISVFIFFILPMFYFDNSEIKKIERSFLFSILISTLIFLIFPTKLGFLNTPEFGINVLLSSLKKVDPPHNLVPSLHVCFTSIVLLSLYKKENSRVFLLFYSIWAILIYSSVIFTHQHHLIDIIGGIVLSFIAIKIFHK
ncbi:phosphatase PAP2 family protein (plasmid) [Leptospira sp. WS39.C2]